MESVNKSTLFIEIFTLFIHNMLNFYTYQREISLLFFYFSLFFLWPEKQSDQHPKISQHYYCEKVKQFVIFNLVKFYFYSYPVSFFTLCYHDNNGCLLFPDHPPEVTNGLILGPFIQKGKVERKVNYLSM